MIWHLLMFSKFPLLVFLPQTICNFFNSLGPLMPLEFSKNCSLCLGQHFLLHFTNLYWFLQDPTLMSTLLKPSLIHKSVRVSLFGSPVVSWYASLQQCVVLQLVIFLSVFITRLWEPWKWGLLFIIYSSVSNSKNAFIYISESNDSLNSYS